ncbi:teneurin-m-like protein [Dinothrombium tinctorium]|uniref:Tenascin-like protein n=1 Tax=Dinothrombium tinctorium TaxID=1965070 RepID=A0A3S3Q267_9ACAR|nr:teneurin-m-like protein [Dinothrombium tinctorium]
MYVSVDSNEHRVCPVMMVETELNPNASDRKNDHVDADGDINNGSASSTSSSAALHAQQTPNGTNSSLSSSTTSTFSTSTTFTTSSVTTSAWVMALHELTISKDKLSARDDNSSQSIAVQNTNNTNGDTMVDGGSSSNSSDAVHVEADASTLVTTFSSVLLSDLFANNDKRVDTNPTSAKLIAQRVDHSERARDSNGEELANGNPDELLPDDNYEKFQVVDPLINTDERRESTHIGEMDVEHGRYYPNDDEVNVKREKPLTSTQVDRRVDENENEEAAKEVTTDKAKSEYKNIDREKQRYNDANQPHASSTSSLSANDVIVTNNSNSNADIVQEANDKNNADVIELPANDALLDSPIPTRNEKNKIDPPSTGDAAEAVATQEAHEKQQLQKQKQQQQHQRTQPLLVDDKLAARESNGKRKTENSDNDGRSFKAVVLNSTLVNVVSITTNATLNTSERNSTTSELGAGEEEEDGGAVRREKAKEEASEKKKQRNVDARYTHSISDAIVESRVTDESERNEVTFKSVVNEKQESDDGINGEFSLLLTTDAPRSYAKSLSVVGESAADDNELSEDNSRLNATAAVDEERGEDSGDDKDDKHEQQRSSLIEESGDAAVKNASKTNFNFNNRTNHANNSMQSIETKSIANKSPLAEGRDNADFMEVKLGKMHSQLVPSYGHWNVQLFQKEPTLVKFNYTIPVGVSIGVYGGKNRVPTHTQYDFMEVIGSGTVPMRAIRSHGNHLANKRVQVAEFIQFLDRGTWYITIYNDASQPQEISFITLIADESNIRCANDCNGHGNCVMGTCKCDADYTGDMCEYRVCPILCSGRGKYTKGQCVCNAGWKGKECELREDECEVSDCSGHGDCVDGVCHCFPGYKGQHCEEGTNRSQSRPFFSLSLSPLPDYIRLLCLKLFSHLAVDCLDPDCSGHGVCVNGMCLCGKGWKGAHCNEPDSNALRCLPDCSGHGSFDLDLQQCMCDNRWMGPDCSQEGCPRNCNNRGECVERDNEWECECNPNWAGHDCSIPLEKDCSDKKDNDNADPLDILLRKQPPSPTASFFQRMQFLIEEDSVQSYAHKQAFNDSRASVIRGQVKSPSGSGLMGVRVGIASEPLLGFVVSRDTGWFDIMVNGGGAVTLHFQREPFRPTQRTVMVPWNEIVVIDKVKMNVDERKLPDYRSPICVEHDYEVMRPVVLGAWKHGFQAGCNQEKGSIVESQVVQETIVIPNTEISLVYHSSRATGYMSTLDLQLTPDKVPVSLRQIHLKIAIEGNLYEKVFEGDPNIKFTYAWNRRNVYRQKVYGIATAIVHVGYEYLNCPQIIWEVQSVKLGGFDMSISDIGGWNLNIHHRFNFHEGILQKGDGQNVYLNNRPKIMTVIMGEGQQRPLHCPYCNGLAREQRLLAPVALASGPDGSIYVGDFNLIRRLSPDGKVTTVIELSASQVAYKYHLTVSPFDGKLYISDPEKHQILRAINLIEPIVNPRNNLEAVVGSGIKCLPGNKNLCGDGRLARDARLAYPKGIAISLNNEMFIADGTNIRMVDSSGLIHTLIGDHYHKSHWKPFPCSGTIPIQKVNLRWPTELAISPLDNSLHILDDHMVLKLTPDKRIRIVAGRPTHCSSVITAHEEITVKEQESVPATQIFLETPQSITFSVNGDLFIAESDSQMINRVRVVSNNGKIHRFAGVDLKCSCMEINCKCFNEGDNLALSSKLSTISSITVTPDGRLHICDQGNLRIRSVVAVNAKLNKDHEYEITSDDNNELYLFNRFGQHIATKNLVSSQMIYSFTYNDNTSNGKLSSVTDATGNKVFLLRDYSNQVKSIESAKGGQCRLTMSRTKLLHTFTAPDSEKITFSYYGNTGLLKSKTDTSENAVIYNYDENGRLISATTPSGELVQLNFSLSNDGPCQKVMKGESQAPQKEVRTESTSPLAPDAKNAVTSVSRRRRIARFHA